MRNWIKKLYRSKSNVSLDEIYTIMKNNRSAILLDVRSEQEFKEGHLNGAINIPTYELYGKARRIIKDLDTIIIVYCSVGLRSQNAIKILRRLGYKNLYHLEGGIDA